MPGAERAFLGAADLDSIDTAMGTRGAASIRDQLVSRPLSPISAALEEQRRLQARQLGGGGDPRLSGEDALLRIEEFQPPDSVAEAHFRGRLHGLEQFPPANRPEYASTPCRLRYVCGLLSAFGQRSV